tara:strand:+ start:258 stop:647 length:390 start_codon:yes stop_codon:yes gene_type:complete
MKLWKIVLFAVIVTAGSCGIQQKPKLQITHVLAVTHEGDTLKLPIDVIRPINYRIINYSSGYGYGWNNWYRPMHNTYYNYNYSSGSTSRSSNNGSSKTNYGNTSKRISSNDAKSIPASDRSSANIKNPK